MLRAVVFDLDETLVDQRTASSTAVTTWAADRGITGDDVVARWHDLATRHSDAYQRRELTYLGQRRARVRDFLGVPLDDAAADETFEDYGRRYRAAWRAFDDALPALRRVRDAGLVVGVLTNGEDDRQRDKAEALGLLDAVDVFVASSTLPAGKPDPRAFTGCLERVGVAAGEALMVGDSLEHDVRGALAAGLDAVLLDRDGRHTDADGVRRITSLQQLRV